MKAALITILIFFLVTNEGDCSHWKFFSRPGVTIHLQTGGEMYMYSDLF